MSHPFDVAELAAAYASKSRQDILKLAFEHFGDELWLSFSGAEDVVLVDMAWKLNKNVKVFSLDTGRLHPETYRFIEQVREHYGIAIDVLAPDATALEALVKEKGLFSFYKDGHSEDIWAYIRMLEIPYNSLHERGFISIGCEPCTRPVLPNQHEREGRWWWEEATQKECGLHAGNLISKG